VATPSLASPRPRRPALLRPTRLGEPSCRNPPPSNPVWHTFRPCRETSHLKLPSAGLAALFSSFLSLAVAQTPTLVAQNAWVRATPGSDVAAAYLTLRNVSAAAVTVTGIESPAAGHAMIHETKVEGGQSRMRPHEQLAIAPGATVKLEPGGLHVMLHDLKQPLAVGQQVPLVVHLADGTTLQVTATVRPLGAE
jgi:periplasmic copper chaperone A